MTSRDDLTKEEIAALPLEMRCCYFLYPWNHSMTETTVEGWANEFGFFRYRGEDTTIEEDVRIANSEANKLIAFVKELI